MALGECLPSGEEHLEGGILHRFAPLILIATGGGSAADSAVLIRRELVP